MLKKTFLGVLFAVLILALLIAGINFNITKAADYESSGTTVGGIIWENTTWTLENSPYIITDTVQIPENVTLTIKPGVIARAGDMFLLTRAMFLLHGRIYALGTADNKIIFDSGVYLGQDFRFFKADGPSPSADLDYTIINGGSVWQGDGGSFSLKHSQLIDVAESYVTYPKKDVYIEYNRFINSRGFSTATDDANVYVKCNLFKGNDWFIVRSSASYDGSKTIVKYNSFIDMAGIVLELRPGYSSAAMTATENYWGTNDTGVIDSMIYDKNDDITCAGFIDYLPILTGPYPDTPTLPLIVNFTYSPPAPHAHGVVTFDASASFGPYSTIANYTWDFGDGNTITLNTPIATHTYTMPGSYNVTLAATDEFGFKNSTTTSLMVLQDDVSSVTTDDYDNEWHVTDLTITLTPSDHESGVAETYYRINDGSVQNVSAHGQPRITTESANNTLEYWSIDNAGNEELPHKILTGIKLDKTAPIANAGVDQTVNEDTLVTFDGSASTDENGVTSYIWAFTIEGVPKTETVVDHSFNQGGGWQHWGFNLEKEDIIHIYYETGSDLFGGPLFFLILNQSKYEEWPNGQWSPPEFSIAHGNDQIENWNWTVPKNRTWHFVFDFRQTFQEDVYIKLTKYWDVTPKTLTGKNPTYTFATPGTYIVTLTVKDTAGNTDTDTVTITVLFDTDGDGTPDVTDTDDDNDGTPDAWEIENGLDPLDAADASLDPDGDGLTNLQEYQGGTDPNVSDSEAQPTESFLLWILGAAVAIIAIAVALTFLWKRRK